MARVVVKDLCSILEAVPLITTDIYTLVFSAFLFLGFCFFGRSFVVRIKSADKSSRELESVWCAGSCLQGQLCSESREGSTNKNWLLYPLT